jgi:hypothetical protein
MTTRKPTSLPDITDDDFRRRLNPLAQAVIPGSASSRPTEFVAEPVSHSHEPPLDRGVAIEPGAGEGRGGDLPGIPDIRNTDYPVEHSTRQSGLAISPAQVAPSPLADRIAAVTHIEAVRTARGPKKGVEFLLPARIVSALKVAAAQEGTSMTVKVLEALRAAGYPITDADFVDLRKLPKR